jgi:hypothetical protein
MRAFAHLDGNFEVSPNRNFGWTTHYFKYVRIVDNN